MIRNLLTTTAFATLVTTSAYAQQDSAAPTTAPAETAQPADPKVEQVTASRMAISPQTLSARRSITAPATTPSTSATSTTSSLTKIVGSRQS